MGSGTGKSEYRRGQGFGEARHNSLTHTARIFLQAHQTGPSSGGEDGDGQGRGRGHSGGKGNNSLNWPK